jgi:hypothetical protein
LFADEPSEVYGLPPFLSLLKFFTGLYSLPVPDAVNYSGDI